MVLTITPNGVIIKPRIVECTEIGNQKQYRKENIMNNFRLPYHLIVQEGIFEHVDEVMADCVPGIKNKKVIIVTDANLQKVAHTVNPLQTHVLDGKRQKN